RILSFDKSDLLISVVGLCGLTSAPKRTAFGRSSCKSASDLLALQIEGSERVILEDGTPLRVGFDSHNGYSFSSIERVLIDRNVIPRKDISTQAIRDWMATHP